MDRPALLSSVARCWQVLVHSIKRTIVQTLNEGTYATPFMVADQVV